MLNQKSAASAVIFILYILFCAQCYSIDAIPQTLAHGEGNINITFTTAQDAKESHDWIGIFPQNMCLDTHSCYFAYAPVAEVLPSRLWEVDSATLHIGLYEARYLKRPSYFSNHELVARKFFNITNSKSPTGHADSDYIGMFEKGACNTTNSCYMSMQFVPSIQVQGTFTFVLPNKDGMFVEFRYVKTATIAVTTSRPVYVRSSADVLQLYAGQTRNDMLYDTDAKKKYEYTVSKFPAKKAILTFILQKNNTAQCSEKLVLLVKHNEMPTKHIFDFQEASSSQVTATFDIEENDFETLGKWYMAVERQSPVTFDPFTSTASICPFTISAMFVNRCPNDCSNRGTCNNGTCICSTGYSRDDCSKGLTPFNPPRKPIHPVLVLPGIGGSSLQFMQDEADGKTNQFPSWLNVDNALSGTIMSSRNRAFVETMVASYNETTCMLDPLAQTIKGNMIVWDEYYGLRGISCLLTDRLKYWVEALHLRSKLDSAYYYQAMFDFMQDQLGYEPGKTLFGFGFDWRQTNRQQERHKVLLERLKNIYEANGAKRVNVIVHSMGGLFFKSFIAAHPEEAKQYVRSWTTIATPHHGAPKAVHALVGGYNFDNPLVDLHDAIALATETPAVYELFPDPFFKFSREPKMFINYTITGVQSYQLQDYAVIGEVLTKVLRNYSITDFTGHTYPKPYRPKIAEHTLESKKIWSQVKLPESIKYYNIYCDNIPTIFDVAYDKTVTDPKDLIASKPNFAYMPGDGTVPAESAFFDGFDAIKRVPISDADHSAIVKDERVFKWLRDWTMNSCPLDGWWSTSILGNFFHIQQQARNIAFKAPLHHHMASFAGYYEGGIVKGEMVTTGYQFVLNVSIDCLGFDAQVFDLDGSSILQFTAQRIIGAECPPNSVTECAVENGVGVQRCYYGHRSGICEVTSCNAGYCAEEDATNYQYTRCAPCDKKHIQRDYEAKAPCPENRPYLCSDGSCKKQAQDCEAQNAAFTHPCALQQVFCANQCMNSIAECMVVIKNKTQESQVVPFAACPSNKPYMCDDGKTCMQYAQECDAVKCTQTDCAMMDKIVEPKACPVEKPYLCSNSECETSLVMCGTQHIGMNAEHSWNMESKKWKFFHLNASTHLIMHVVGNVSVYVCKNELPSVFEHDHAAVANRHSEHVLSICPKTESHIFVGVYNSHEDDKSVKLRIRERDSAAAKIETCATFAVHDVTPLEMQHRGLVIAIAISASFALALVVVVLGAVYIHSKKNKRNAYVSIN